MLACIVSDESTWWTCDTITFSMRIYPSTFLQQKECTHLPHLVGKWTATNLVAHFETDGFCGVTLKTTEISVIQFFQLLSSSQYLKIKTIIPTLSSLSGSALLIKLLNKEHVFSFKAWRGNKILLLVQVPVRIQRCLILCTTSLKVLSYKWDSSNHELLLVTQLSGSFMSSVQERGVFPKDVAVSVTTGDTLFCMQLIQYMSYVTAYWVNGKTRDHYVSRLHGPLCERDHIISILKSLPWLPVPNIELNLSRYSWPVSLSMVLASDTQTSCICTDLSACTVQSSNYTCWMALSHHAAHCWNLLLSVYLFSEFRLRNVLFNELVLLCFVFFLFLLWLTV